MSLSDTRLFAAAAIARGPRMQEMSEAIPFLEKPMKLDPKAPGLCPSLSE
jgi:hypothetical protein